MQQAQTAALPEYESRQEVTFRLHIVRASILIKSNDQHEYLEQIFPRIYEQTERSFEIIFLYSGSNDATVELARQWGAQVIRIEPQEFSHPRALNIGAHAAQGEFVVVLSADAVPASERWLENLLQPFQAFQDPTVAGVYGRHIPRSGANPSSLDRWRMRRRYGDTPYLLKENKTNHFSNANSALRRNLWEQHVFDERLKEIEDYEWARWAQMNGYSIAYEPKAAVEHTHGEQKQYSFIRYLARVLRFQLLKWEIDGQFSAVLRPIRFFTKWQGIGLISKRVMPSVREIDPIFAEHKLIKIPKVHTTVDPKVKEMPCACGGTLRYGIISFSAMWNGKRLEVGEVQAYRCDQSGEYKNCNVIMFLPSIAREMEWYIDKARGTLTLSQKLEGLIKKYSPEPKSL